MIDLMIYSAGALATGAYFLKTQVKHGFVYAKFPNISNNNAAGSYANQKDIKRGYSWTAVSDLKKKFRKDDKHRVYIDNFRVDDDYAKESKMSNVYKKSVEKTEIYLNPLKMTQGILLVGKMGSGKTEFYFNILKQKFYNRVVIHQVKAGDFVETLLRKRDMLFSPYDERGYLWDVMSENEGIIKTFFENYSNAVQGDKKDFFSSASMRLYNEMAQKIKTKYSDVSSAEKWMLLIKAVKDLFAEMESGTQNSKKDIKGTMEAILEPLEIMAWKMQNPNQKKFIIKDFFEKKNQTRLILDNIPEYEKSLTPLFTAFTACMSQVHTSMPDTNINFTLYAIDEYLSFAQIMDEPSKKRLHTLIRSKGGILMPAVQYIPKDDKKLQQLLTSSAYAWIYFSVIEDETINLLKNSIGETEYTYEDENVSYSKGSKNKSYSTKNEKYNILNNHILNGLGNKFEHITYIPNNQVIYKAYTPQADLKPIAAKQVEADLSGFYAIKYAAADGDMEDLKNLTFEDLFKDKPLSKVEEWRLWKKFEATKKQGVEAIKSFKKENALEVVNLEFLFQKYMEDRQKIENKMKMFNTNERFELFKQFNSLKGNDAEELAFIEEHDLFGALPSFFNFDMNSEDIDI